MVRFPEIFIDPIIPISSPIFYPQCCFQGKEVYENGPKLLSGERVGNIILRTILDLKGASAASWEGVGSLCCRSHVTGQEYRSLFHRQVNNDNKPNSSPSFG